MSKRPLFVQGNLLIIEQSLFAFKEALPSFQNKALDNPFLYI